MKRSERTKVMTEALERLAKHESSGDLADPERSKELGVYGYESEEHHSQNCVVATYVYQRTGLLVEISYCNAGGYVCAYEGDGDLVAVRVPTRLNKLIYDFDHKKRSWLIFNTETKKEKK